ncbi:hypothetical protein FIBSPDRAFT_944732 [Athelia psychrophila]|uniref:DUF6533 domain-containing protein n=1 Tax=Athelia psychrophila TaxID=1759441 RepID=A0A166UFX8_9AGAM|nr:hypothetical protein FIBSPDRAFT_944732 [Fibularhizoctonia sp. CBS 109695]
MSTTPEPISAPLNYLNSLAAKQAGHYINVACLTLCIWDWLIALPDEYEIARKAFQRGRHLGRAVNIVYFVCRSSTFSMQVACLMMDMVPLKSCVGVGRAVGILDGIATPATALLFYSRVSAVYLHEKPAVIFFGVCWLALWATFLYDASNTVWAIGRVPGTDMCNLVRRRGGFSYVAIAVYDTLVYLAISWRLSSLSMHGDHWQARMTSLVTGKGLYRLSRSLLRLSQMYYFVSIGFSIVVAVFSVEVSPYWKGQLVPLALVIPTVLACRLFREVRLGLTSDSQALPTLREVAVSSVAFASHHTSFREESDDPSKSDDLLAEIEMDSRAGGLAPP